MYKIIGADGKEYGPISVEQLRMWIRDGRINEQTRAKSQAGGDWQPLSAFPEFAEIFGITAPPPEAYTPPPVTPGPISSSFASSGSRDVALRVVRGPAISLIVVASIGVFLCLLVAVRIFTGGPIQMPPPPANLPPDSQQTYQFVTNLFQGPFPGLLYLFCAAMNGLVLFGAIKMMQLRSRGLATTACVIGMLPATCFCCVLGLPFGIWGLVALNKPEVKSEFDKM